MKSLMSKLPLVSVILPSHNHIHYVARAVESVLDQDFRDLELIVVDDGSTDGTPDRVAAIKDSRLRLVRLSPNRLRHPRNLALSMALGSYVAFQNSDDVWLPGKLRKQLELLERENNTLVCFTDVEVIDEHDAVLSSSWANGLFVTKNRTNLGWLRRFFDTGNCLCITSALVRRKSIQEVGGFRGSLIQLSDLDLWVRLAAVGDFHILNEKLTCFRVLGGKTPEALNVRPKPTLTSAWVRLFKNRTPAGHNLSAPESSVVNRAQIEFADVLGNYARPPILGLTPRIFDDRMPDFNGSNPVRLASLARYAWSIGSVPHSLFADRLMASILEDDGARKIVTDVFGAGIVTEFIRRRGQLSLCLQKDDSGPA
jgi:hypothetical protein